MLLAAKQNPQQLRTWMTQDRQQHEKSVADGKSELPLQLLKRLRQIQRLLNIQVSRQNDLLTFLRLSH
jgi:hypothetical protein